MKKIISITMMLVAIMVATVSFSSCSKDDDNKDVTYKLDVSLKIDEPGNLTTAECEALIIQAANQSTTAPYPSDEAAQIGTGMAAEALAEGLEKEADKFGAAVFSYTLKCTKSNGTQIITYYVDFDNGDVNCYNNKN